jgi:hypothetical protein
MAEIPIRTTLAMVGNGRPAAIVRLIAASRRSREAKPRKTLRQLFQLRMTAATLVTHGPIVGQRAQLRTWESAAASFA